MDEDLMREYGNSWYHQYLLYNEEEKKRLDAILGEGKETTLREYLSAAERFSNRPEEEADLGILDYILISRGECTLSQL